MKSTLLATLALFAAILPAYSINLHNQDVWRKMNVTFAAPTSSTLRCAAVSDQFFFTARVISGQPDKIVKYDLEDGTELATFTQEYGYVQGLACDASGRLFVFDRSTGLITIVNEVGDSVSTFGGLGSGDGLFASHAVAYTTLLAFSSDGELYACDPGNRRMQVFDSNGVFQRAWGEAGALPSQFNTNQPDRVAVTSAGKVFVGSKIFDSNGTYLSASNWYLTQVAPDGVGNYMANYYGHRRPIDPVTGKLGTIYNGPYSKSIQNWANADGIYDKAGNFYEVYLSAANFFKREYVTAPNFPSAGAIPLPSVVSAAQRSGTNLVDVVYQVDDADSATVQTGLLAFLNGGGTLNAAIPMCTFLEGTSGNVGVDQATGTQLSVVWDMTADWAADFADIRVEVLANDGRNLHGIHWIEIPSDGVSPAVQISADPITNDQLVEIWFWLLATRSDIQVEKDPRSPYSEVRVFTDVGDFANATLVEYRGSYNSRQPITTDAGRLFAAQNLGGRPVNRAEITRATLGNYNFGTVNTGNITKGGISPDAYLKSWGTDNYGELDWLPFTGVIPTRVALNGSTSLFLGNDNRLWGMGYNGYGQLGTNTTNQSLAIPIADNVTQIGIGTSHSVYLDTSNNLYGLGRNNLGQLNQSDTSNKTTPVLIDNSVTQVSAAGDYTYYLKGSTLYKATTSGPSIISNGVTKVAIGAQGDYFYLTSSGDLWGWGRNHDGLLGVSGSKSFADRVLVDQTVADVAVGWDFVVYRKTDGSLWGLGENEFSQILSGSTAPVTTPFPIESSGVLEVVAGNDHVLYRKTDNSLHARGRNHLGQLGNGDFSNVTDTSAQVDSNVSALAAGGDDSIWVTLP